MKLKASELAVMAKRVIVIASGSTEQVVLRHLTAQSTADGIDVEVRFPSRHRRLRFETVSQLINAALYDSVKGPPDKFVVPVDTDGKTPEEAMDPIKNGLERSSFRELRQRIHYAYAQWHLEAWFFADGVNLRITLATNHWEMSIRANQIKFKIPSIISKTCSVRSAIQHLLQSRSQLLWMQTPSNSVAQLPWFHGICPKRGYGIAAL